MTNSVPKTPASSPEVSTFISSGYSCGRYTFRYRRQPRIQRSHQPYKAPPTPSVSCDPAATPFISNIFSTEAPATHLKPDAPKAPPTPREVAAHASAQGDGSDEQQLTRAAPRDINGTHEPVAPEHQTPAAKPRRVLSIPECAWHLRKLPTKTRQPDKKGLAGRI